MSIHRYYLVSADADVFFPANVAGATVTVDGCSPAYVDLNLSDDLQKPDLDVAMDAIGWTFFESSPTSRLPGFGGPNLVVPPFTIPVVGGDYAATAGGTLTLPALAGVPTDKPVFPTALKALGAAGVTVAPTGGDTIDGGGAIFLEQNDATLLLPDVANLRWLKYATGTVRDVFWAGTNYDGNKGDYRAKTQTGTADFRYTFNVPADFGSLLELVLVGVANATIAAVDIDLASDYAAAGELFNAHSEADVVSTYSFNIDEMTEVDISAVFSAIAAGDYCGIFVQHQGIGTTVNYLGIRMKYVTA